MIAAADARRCTSTVVLVLVAGLAGCDRGAPPAPRARPTPKVAAARPDTFSISFEDAPVAYVQRGVEGGNRVEDDRPCLAVGRAWPEAEAATEAALRHHLQQQPACCAPKRVTVQHEASPDGWDIYGGLASRHVRDSAAVSLRITAAAGYAMVRSDAGVEVFCIEVVRRGNHVELLPRLVRETYF